MNNIFTRVLKFCEFNEIASTPNHRVLYTLDFLACSVYYILSIICIGIEKASCIVLFLNGLCLLRKILKNIIEGSKITNMINEAVNLAIQITAKSYYRRMGLGQTVAGGVTFLYFCFSQNISSLGIKVFSITFICLVYIDDLIDILTCAYDAHIKPII